MTNKLEVTLKIKYDPECGDLVASIFQDGLAGIGTDTYDAHRAGEVAAFARDLTAQLLIKMGWKEDDANFALAQRSR
jgi:hypothetical protein